MHVLKSFGEIELPNGFRHHPRMCSSEWDRGPALQAVTLGYGGIDSADFICARSIGQPACHTDD